MQETLITYKFYDEQGRRVAIFGTPKNPDSLIITVITCSKKDNFSKKKAKELYNAWKNWQYVITALDGQRVQIVHPKLVTLTGITEGNYKAAFMVYCNTHFQKPVSWTERIFKTAVKNGKKTRILQEQNVANKLDLYSIE